MTVFAVMVLSATILSPLVILFFSIRNLRRSLQTPDEPIDSTEALRDNYQRLVSREEDERNKERIRQDSLRHLKRERP